MKVLLWILVLVVVGASVFIVHRFLKRRGPRPEPYFRFLCPHCNRKLHYRAHKAGRQGICPRCKQRCTFPMLPHSEW